MDTEKKLVAYVHGTRFEDIPPEPLTVVRNQILTVFGTTIAGSVAQGCEPLVRFYKTLRGKKEATILIHGGKIPAQYAALLNGVMARALDFCDALAPGAHIGSSIVPAALAAAELAGGCNGRDFLAAVAVGTEVAARLNLTESTYDGLDPTGICVPFASTVAAARILGLSEMETWNALALAFNRCGGSFQSNVDGSLAVRVIQGWVAESGVMCARFARKGITGPRNFLEGVYGYLHLYGRNKISPDTITGELGTRFELLKVLFKKYPSCGLTLGSTEAILNLMEETGISAEDVDRVEVTVPPYAYKLVGHPFEIGENPKVNAQFSIRYCVANALTRKCSKLEHFEEASVRDPRVTQLAEKITVIGEEALEKRGHTPLDLRVLTKTGKEYVRSLDIAPGFPGNPLGQDIHERRFNDCLAFSGKPLPKQQTDRVVALVNRLEEIGDVRTLIPLLLA